MGVRLTVPRTSPPAARHIIRWLEGARLLALLIVAATTVGAPTYQTRNLIAVLVAFAVGLAVIGLMTALEADPGSHPSLRRLLPAALAVMTITSGIASLTPNGGPFSLLSTMATSGAGAMLDGLRAGVVTAIGAVTTASVSLAYNGNAWDTIGYPLVMVIGLLLGRLVRSYRAQVEQTAALLAQADELRHEQNQVAALDERNRIAREIHDVLAHSLGALGVQLQAAQAVLTDRGDIPQAVELLAQARRVTSDGLSETRRAIQALRAEMPRLPDALAGFSTEHQRRYGTRVTCAVTGTPRPLSPEAGLALTRAAQEALVNAAKHAPHQPVDVRLAYGPDGTTLTVANPLPPGDRPEPVLETANGGYGLAGLRERLLLIDGTLGIGPDDGRWVVTARVPPT